MKITKYVHSCLLVQTPERVGMIDPGNYSWESGLFDLGMLDRLDDIIITHEHPDHAHLPFIQALVEKFPSVCIITTPSMVEILKAAGVSQAEITGNEATELFDAVHETMKPLGEPPQNTGVHYLSRLTHPGDSHHILETKDILALPITAPWGTVNRAAELVEELKPKYVIPIHDWHWNEKARAFFYDRFSDYCSQLGIQFIKVRDGEAVEL